MKIDCGRLLAVVSLVLAHAACADAPRGISAPVTAAHEQRVMEPTPERAALSVLGRLIAVSLGDKSVRHQLKRHLRAAPFKEHKLELGRYLREADGEQLLEAMSRQSSSDEILTLIAQVRPVEFYMPVRKHRESWTGDGEVLVAVQLEEEDPIIAFDRTGRELQLDPTSPPEQPTLSIVASETRFDQPMPSSARNVGDMNGRAIGTLVPAGLKASSLIAIDPGAGGGGGSSGGGSVVPSGLYLEFSRILDFEEPFTRGDPELEVHIQGPGDQGNPRLGEDLSCSGEHAYDARKAFDQNTAFWEGRVMLFSADEVSRFNARYSDGFHVMFWEDDDTSCVLKLDNLALLEFIKATSLATGTVALKVIPLTWRLGATLFLATMFTNPGEWLMTNDDFVGAAVAKENAGYDYPTNTHVIMQGTTLNGRVTLISR